MSFGAQQRCGDHVWSAGHDVGGRQPQQCGWSRRADGTNVT